MGMLYHLEEEADKKITHQMRQTLQDALSRYKPMCGKCDLALHRHHSYGRVIITKFGEMRLNIPVFRCGECGGMSSGMELIGNVERGKRFSKKRGKRR